MKPEQINIAIAESVGWTEITTNEDDGWVCGYEPNPNIIKICIPNCTSDLNACSDALNHLFENVWYAEDLTRYGKALELEHDTAVLNMTEDESDLYYEFAILSNMTAAQTSRAIIKTLGKWVESAKENIDSPARLE